MIGDDERPGRVGRPRDPSVERRLLAAAREELAERGAGGFSLRSVARRAGVARPTVALRWQDAESLIVDALDDLPAGADVEAPLTRGSLREDLLALVDGLAAQLGSPLLELQMRLVADAERYPGLLEKFQDRVMRSSAERFEAAVRAAVERGELAPDVDRHLLADGLIGTFLLRTLASPRRTPPGPPARRALVDKYARLFGA